MATGRSRDVRSCNALNASCSEGAGGGHKAGPTHPSWRHGVRSQEWVEMRRHTSDLARVMEALIG